MTNWDQMSDAEKHEWIRVAEEEYRQYEIAREQQQVLRREKRTIRVYWAVVILFWVLAGVSLILEEL